MNSEYTGLGNADERFLYVRGGNGYASSNQFNQWVGFQYDNQAHGSSNYLHYWNSGNANLPYDPDTAATMTPYKKWHQSPFSLFIPQAGTDPLGTGTLLPASRSTRIGDDVNIVSDDWKIIVSIPKFYPQVATATPSNDKWVANANELTQRFFKVRMVCVLQDSLDAAGKLGYAANDLFEDVYELFSRFKYNGARGYKVLLDETKTIMNCDHGEDRNTDVKSHAVFKVKAAYLRRYTPGYAFETSETLSSFPHKGVNKGVVSWYMFIYDEGEELVTETTDELAATKQRRVAIKNPTQAQIEVYRDTYFTDL